MLRTGMLAIVVGAVFAWLRGGLARWPKASSGLRSGATGWRLGSSTGCALALSIAHGVQVAARVGVWFVGGAVVTIGMGLTAMALAKFRPARWPSWWLGGGSLS